MGICLLIKINHFYVKSEQNQFQHHSIWTITSQSVCNNVFPKSCSTSFSKNNISKKLLYVLNYSVKGVKNG